MKQASNRSRRAFATLLVATVLALVPSLAEAQAPAFAWFPKFVCGFETGNIRLLNNPAPLIEPVYEGFKPGNYATTINILNTSLVNQTVLVTAVITTGLPNPSSLNVNLPPIPLQNVLQPTASAARVDCTDIANAALLAGVPLMGEVFEGFLALFPTSGNRVLTVSQVYTYASQNAFAKHKVYGADNAGQVVIIDQQVKQTLAGLLSTLTSQLPGGFNEIAAAGAGGLGLGASIDVEKCDPVEIDLGAIPGGLTAVVEKLGEG